MFKNMYINLYSIPQFLISIVCFIYGLFILFKNRKAKLNQILAMWCFACFVWLVGYALSYSSRNASFAEVFVKIASIGVTFIAIFSWHFIIEFLDLKREKKLLYLGYIVALALIPLFLFTGYFLSGVNKYFFGYYGKAAAFYPYYLVFYFLIIGRILFIVYNLIVDKQLIPLKRMQAKYVLIGFFIASLATIDFIPKFGIEIYPFGCIFMVVWVFVTSYAIFKHQLMDINIVIQKSFVYSVLISLITAIYFIFVFLAEKFFQGMFGYTSLIVSIFYAFTIALFFIPVKNRIQHLADRIFLGKDPIQIAQENELMRQELERAERLKAVAHFASGMAHEIKNPLTAIKTFAEYLPEKKNDPEFLNKFSKIVSGEVGRIDSLVHQLLDFAKPAPLNLQEIDINNLLDDTLSLLSNEFLKHSIKLVKEYQAQNSQLKADSNKLKQAFLNLFLNSIEAMPNGGSLTVSTSIGSIESPSLEPSRAKSRDEDRESSIEKSVLISISDTGCGIPDKDLPHIFEPFYSTKEQGTGLGLSIVYNIIKEHDGNIKVESQKDKGASFAIKLKANKN
ncbi:MAG: ATP-binding protein [Candidatus Omnitrophica bacterium]|nr:ATP-binding protein [Candidatus Omnitrophota bacterium]